LKNIEKISNECIKKEEVVNQLSRLDQEDANNTVDRQSLNKFKDTINEFTEKVKRSDFDFLKPGTLKKNIEGA
jgi:hypothetical protein